MFVIQVILGNGTVEYPVLLGTSAWTGLGIHASAVSTTGDVYSSGQDAASNAVFWVRDGTTGVSANWLGPNSVNTETMLFYKTTLYAIYNLGISRLGAVGTIPDAASGAPTVTQITAAYGTSSQNPKSFMFEVSSEQEGGNHFHPWSDCPHSLVFAAG